MKIATFVFRCCFVMYVQAASNAEPYPRDQTSPRANTLFDDPDDIQKQLDNEAKDRNKFGKLKTIWVFHLPTQFPGIRVTTEFTRRSRQIRRTRCRSKKIQQTQCLVKEESPPKWEYKDQNNWGKAYPLCAGTAQSPVDLPHEGLPKAREGRKMIFGNYNVKPKSMTLVNDGKGLTLYGDWPRSERPIIYGGAAHSRCYIFHSLTIHWPSEHTISGLQFPLETQSLYVSSVYGSFEEALNASSSDQLAFISVATLYKYSEHTHEGLFHLLHASVKAHLGNNSIRPQPLRHLQPPFRQYASYHGSLTKPPCTESVHWFIRARSLPVTRALLDTIQDKTSIGQRLQFNFRQVQRMNDRDIFLFT